MGLLDGDILGDVLRSAAGVLYASGTLYRTTLSDNGDGSYTPAVTSFPCQAQENILSEQARAALGYTAKEAQILILRDPALPEPNTDDKIETNTGVFAITGKVETDPARSHWICRCERSRLTDAEAGAT